MKQLFIYTLCVTLLASACSDGNNVKSSSNDSAATAHPQHTDTADTSGSGQMDMMGIMMKMDREMRNAALTGDADRDFAQLMKTHHQSAVEMAQLEVAQGTDSAIKNMAQKMIADQQKEIAAFDQFLQSGNKGTSSETFKKELQASMKEMDHSSHGTGTIDQQFLAMMIPHHQGAIDMARPYLKYANDPTLKSIAQAIITSQQAEIQQMKNLQQGHQQH